MTTDQRTSMSQLFEQMKKRPGMWFSPQVPPIVIWFQGFQMALKLQNPSLDAESVFRTVALQRGWQSGAQPVWRQMEERGFSPEAINAELLAIYTTIWEQVSTPDPIP